MNGWFAIANPAAGGGRCGRLVGPALEQLRQDGLDIELATTQRAGQGVDLVRDAWRRGFRRFIAIGGDGTAHEMVNGLFVEPPSEVPTLGFLPLGTGNSFLRDFARDGLTHARQALLEQRRSPCDVIRLTHSEGRLHYINLLSMGFSAEVAALTNRRLKGLGQFGYLVGVMVCLWRRRLHTLPFRCDEDRTTNSSPCLLLTLSNSKYTGGKMLIARDADVADGLIECVRVGPIGRLALIRALRRLYDGTYVDLAVTTRRAVRRVAFELDRAVDVMVDGEVLTLRCRQLDVLPRALQVVA